MGLYNADDIKFLLTLRGICVAYRLGKLVSPEVRKISTENDLIAQFKAERENIGRYFILRGGKLESRRGIHPNPEWSWVFSDSATAFKILSAGTDEAVAQATMEGKVRSEGDAGKGFWFLNMMKVAKTALMSPADMFKKKTEEE